MKNFVLGLLASATLFLGLFGSYVLFCPHAKTLKAAPVINQYITIPGEPMMPPIPIKPKKQFGKEPVIEFDLGPSLKNNDT